MKWGFTGVDVFFVLSGFVVYRTATAAIQARQTVAFIKHRLFRVYLGYWPALIAFTIVSTAVLHRPLPPVATITYSALLFYHNLADNWLSPAWSLTFELCFYGWVVGLVFLSRRKPGVAIALALLFVVMWNAAWLLSKPDMVYGGTNPFRYALTAFGVEFLGGALLSEVYDTTKRRQIRLNIAVPVVACSIAVLGFAIGTTSPSFSTVDILRVGTFGIAAIGCATLFMSLQFSAATPPKWIVKIGDASYSLYLLHTFLLDVGALLRLRLERQVNSNVLTACFLLLMPIVIVVLSIRWYQFIERPILKFALRKFG
jgi:peptidoglycan/LPS O-acetylase OafA/YrhL